MNCLADIQFDCLNAVSEMGALCLILDDEKRSTGMFAAVASSRVPAGHPGWPYSIVSALYVMKLLTKTPNGEYVITTRGRTACIEHRAKKQRETVIRAAESNPGKIILMSRYKEGVS